MSLSHLRIFSTLKVSKLNSRLFHNTKKHPEYSGGASFDQYAAHSPLQHSRFKIDEKRSKIFFEHPPIPNRIPKFLILFMIMATFTSGVRDKIRRRNKKFLKEEERRIFRQILPFVQAMENLRFTALEQKNYMLIKAVADSTQPGNFENVRWRFHQEDIFIPYNTFFPRSGSSGSPYISNQSRMDRGFPTSYSTYYDKGLFDTREVGYIY